jgi:hypothetical protein
MNTKAVVTTNRRKRTSAFAVMGAVLILLTGCATTTRYRNALHPEYGQTEFDRDWYECRRENTRPKVSSVVVPNIGTYDAGMVVDENMARSCFAARGWRPVTSGSPQTPPPERIASTSTAPSAPAPDEKVRTERLQLFAREYLDKPYVQAPSPCGNGVWSSVKNYVVDLSPKAEAAGLRKGDRLLGFGEISLAQYDPEEAWSKMPRGDEVAVRVDRAGTEVSIQFPCRENVEAWRAVVNTWRAVVDGQWQVCVDGVGAYTRAIRMTSASTLRIAWECMRERAKAAGQRPPDEYWRTLHGWATKAIEESRYRPTGLTEIRTSLLNAADALEKAGHSSWAHDIRQQIATSRP